MTENLSKGECISVNGRSACERVSLSSHPGLKSLLFQPPFSALAQFNPVVIIKQQMVASAQYSDYVIMIVKQHSISLLTVNAKLKSLPWASLHYQISTLKKYLAIPRSVSLHNIYVQLHLYKENNVLLKTVARSDSSFGTCSSWLHPENRLRGWDSRNECIQHASHVQTQTLT